MKLMYFDLETTGVKFWKNGIHQISGAIEINGEIKEHFDFKCCPYKDAIIEDEALKVSNVTREQVLNYLPMELTYLAIYKMLGKYVDKFNKKDKFYLVGYNNASFDNAFFRAFFVQCKDQYFGSWFWSCPIDVMVLAGQYLMHERSEMENFQQSTVAKHLGIEVDETRLHDAVYDVEILRQIYKIVKHEKTPLNGTERKNGNNRVSGNKKTANDRGAK